MDLHGGNRIPVQVNTSGNRPLEGARIAGGLEPPDALALVDHNPAGGPGVNGWKVIQGPGYDGTVGLTFPNVVLEFDKRPGSGENYAAVPIGDITCYPSDTEIIDATVGAEEADV